MGRKKDYGFLGMIMGKNQKKEITLMENKKDYGLLGIKMVKNGQKEIIETVN